MTQNGNSAAAPASDVDLLSDIFSAPPVAAAAPVAANNNMGGGGFDMFSQPAAAAIPQQQPVAAAPMANDLFAPQPAVGMSTAAVNNDPFGSTSSNTPAAPTTLAPQQATPAPGASVGGPTPAEVVVQGFTHQGLTVEFKCTKPDAFNKQNSVLVARFINTTDAALVGIKLQVAVPKYITMEMKPPTSTTVPVTGGSSTKEVTQTVSVNKYHVRDEESHVES